MNTKKTTMNQHKYGCNKMVILTARYDDATLLDYRSGPEPKVLLADLANDPNERVRAEFENLNKFFSALRREKDTDEVAVEYLSTRADLSRPSQFWGWCSAAPSKRIDETDWEKTSIRLGVHLPESLKVLYLECDGGNMVYSYFSRPGERFCSFPSGKLSALDQIITLKELAERLNFDQYQETWVNSISGTDLLVVLSAKFETVLLLDYRAAGTDGSPSVLWVENLDSGEDSAVCLGNTVDDFLEMLRGTKHGRGGVSCPIGDLSISAIGASPETFWINPLSHPGATRAAIEEAEARTELTFPKFLKDAYIVSNGGAVAFNFIPPEIVNLHGYKNYESGNPQWENVFIDRVCSVDKLQTMATLEKGLREETGPWKENELWSMYFNDLENILVFERYGEENARLVTLDYRPTTYAENVQLLVFNVPLGKGEPEIKRKINSCWKMLRAKR